LKQQRLLRNEAVLALPMSKKAAPAAAPPAETVEKKVHASTRTGGPRNLLVRDVIREVAGWSPYEKRAQDLIKLDRPKAARAFLKKRLGSFDRARRKQLYLEEIVREEARQHAHHEAK
jgi:large subunit ribosomal protein L36e